MITLTQEEIDKLRESLLNSKSKKLIDVDLNIYDTPFAAMSKNLEINELWDYAKVYQLETNMTLIDNNFTIEIELESNNDRLISICNNIEIYDTNRLSELLEDDLESIENSTITQAKKLLENQ